MRHVSPLLSSNGERQIIGKQCQGMMTAMEKNKTGIENQRGSAMGTI